MSVRSLRYNSLMLGQAKYRSASTDRDAAAFLEAAGIYKSDERKAIYELVRLLKQYGLWSKMKAIYPFVGGTATTHKWNLKDPRDLDAAFRLTFSGGWTHSSTGADPNGTNANANTFLTPTTHLTENSTHLTYYSRENITGQNQVEIGYWGSPNRIGVFCRYQTFTGTDQYNFNTNRVLIENQNTAAFFIGTRTSSTSLKLFRNNTQLSTTNTSASSGFSSCTGNVLLCMNNGSFDYSSKECAFASIGDGLTDTEAANLYSAVDKYQRLLSRNV